MRSKQKIKKYVALLMGLTMGLMFSMNVMAYNPTESAEIDGTKITARSYVMESFGVGSTTCSDFTSSVYVSVSGIYTYTYIDPLTGLGGSSENSSQGVSSADITITAPKGYRSRTMTCSHSATKGAQNWNCITEATY